MVRNLMSSAADAHHQERLGIVPSSVVPQELAGMKRHHVRSEIRP